MAHALHQLLFADALAPESANTLTQWLLANKTGKHRIRAEVPSKWLVGDKTGTCRYGSTHDVAVIWPEEQEPILLAIYYRHTEREAKANEAILRAATRLVIASLNSQ